MRGLYVQNVSKSFNGVKALDGVELSVEQGEFMVIMGPSGCGKTTLLLVILGALKPDKGLIWIGDREISRLPIEERNIGYVPQDFGLFPHLNVYENIAFGLRVKGYSKSEVDSKVKSLLRMVDLEGFELRKPRELSGGQRQRVALARALAINPSLLLLDEPLSNIDEATKSDVIANLKNLQRKTGITTVCVTHNPEDAFKLGDRIAIMYLGKIIQCGKPKEILENPKNEVIKRLIAPILI
ncbi:MAG: ABC transporter ATP-binding protein [Candidatus Bathyarchaeia archaeon]|nr:ABC transporter ATP-binding protein [Candidatus Bathyarchaeota archaeon]